MKAQALMASVRAGVTLRELRGITEEEMGAALSAARKLIRAGAAQAAAEVLAGLALHDPYRPEVWRCLQELFAGLGQAEPARLFSDLARVMA
jgi:hypothetical protein